jgi:hypothetical protein
MGQNPRYAVFPANYSIRSNPSERSRLILRILYDGLKSVVPLVATGHR